MAATAPQKQPAGEEFVITRVFDAPRDLVWKVHTDCAHLKHWWGPKGFKVTSCKIDLRPGGIFHYRLQSANGQEMWGKFVYREIEAPRRLVFVVSFSDEQGGATRHPMSPNWPLEMLSILTFSEQGNKTTVTLRWSPLHATEEERQVFASGFESMRQGWTGTLDQLADYLAKSQTG
jgi:uncharacterized protein YndB with AHSA1/START domain